MSRRRITKPRCKVCASPRRGEIEFAHCGGIGLDSIAAKYPLGGPNLNADRMSIWRHCSRHLDQEMRAAYLADVDVRGLAERAHAESMSLLDYLVVTRGLLFKQLQLAAGLNDRHATAALSGKMVELLKLSGAVTGELARLQPSSTTNHVTMFVQSPAYADLSSMLVRALAAFPEALSAVLAGLDQLEAKAGTGALPALNAPLIDGTALGGAHASAA